MVAILLLLIPTSLGILLMRSPENLSDVSTNEPVDSRIDIIQNGVSNPISNGDSVQLTDDVQVEIFIAPYPPDSSSASMDLYLVTIGGEPVTDAEIRLEYDMLYMFHGASKIDANNLGNGHYLASLDFIMYGPWGFDIIMKLSDQENQWHLWMDIYVWPID